MIIGRFPNEKKIVSKSSVLLIEFIETGTIQAPKEVIDFEGQIGNLMINYLAFKASQRLAKYIIDEHEQHLFCRFLRFLKGNGIISIQNVNQLHILNYIKSINPKTLALAHLSILISCR